MDTVFIDGIEHKIGARGKGFRLLNSRWVLSPKPASEITDAIALRDEPEKELAMQQARLTPSQKQRKAEVAVRRRQREREALSPEELEKQTIADKKRAARLLAERLAAMSPDEMAEYKRRRRDMQRARYYAGRADALEKEALYWRRKTTNEET